MKIDFKNLFFISLRTCVAIIFIYASIDKIVNPAEFSEIVYNYRLVPVFANNLFSLWLPWLEFVCGIFLLFGIWELASISLIAVLMLIFLSAICANMVRGIDIVCGCFVTHDKVIKSVFSYIIRDIVIFILVAAVCLVSFKKNIIYKG